MNEITNRYRKNGAIMIVLAMLSVLFAPFIRITEAAETEQIIKNLEIVQKSDEYFPGESIYIKGDWSIPDDTPGNQYKAGDTFSMTIPQGLEAGFPSVNLGGLATGKIVGDKLVFTFTDEIEGLANRKGGFQLRFEVKSPDEEGKSEVDIGSKDENGNVLITDKITVNKPEQGEVVSGDERFSKAEQWQTMDGLRWYVRINKNNLITGNQVKFEDQLGPDHILKEDTIKVEKHISSDPNYPDSNRKDEDITDEVDIIIDSDKKGFTIPKLELDNAPGGYKHYTIYYETQYTGDETEGKVQLENTAKVISEDQGVLYPDHSKDEGVVEGEFDLGVDGWGIGDQWVKFKVKKVDSVTKEPLAGAKFKLSHKIDENFTPIEFTTDENGEYEHNGYINNGLYVLEELEAPEGYEKMDPQDVRILHDPQGGGNQVFEFEIENKLKPISIKGEKEWFDENNKPIASQEDIAVSLYANGEKVRQQILPKGETAFEFKNLPQKDEDGEIIEYTIKEVGVAGYTTSITGDAALGFTITNTKNIVDPEPELTEVSVEKEWIGEVGDSVTVNLLADGKQVDTVDLNESNNWKHSFTDLAVVNDSGSVIEYTVEEVEVAGYTTSIAGNAALGFIITNTKDIIDPEPELTEVSVEKEWIGEASDSVIVNLLADGKQVDTVNLNEGNNWKHSFTDLAVVNDSGSVIEYTVEEVEVAGYTTSIAGNDALGFIITNTKDIVDPEPERTEVSVEKTWIGEKQDQVTVHLLADGKQVDTVEINEDNNWKHSFTDLAVVNDAGSVIEYTVEEAEVAGYTTSIAGNAALGFTITNTKDTVDPEPELTEVSVEKEWIGEKQDQVTVHLLADGKQVNTVDLNKDNNWKHSFTDLAVVNDSGSVIEYTVEEVEVAGYTTSIAGNAALGFIITNTKDIVDPKPELTEISVEKEWIGEVGDSVTVNLLADGKQVDTVDLNEDNNWKHTFTNLAVVNDSGSVIEYTVEEVEVAGYTTSIAGNTALGFTITNTKDSKSEEPKPEEPKPEEPKPEDPKPENPKSEDPKHEKLPQTGEATNFLVSVGIVLIIIGLWTLITKTNSKV